MPQPNKYYEKADDLLFRANTLAISSMNNLCNRFPVLDIFIKDDRDFIFLMTIAGVAVGVLLVDENLSEDDHSQFTCAVAERLIVWDFLGYSPYGKDGAFTAYKDLFTMIGRGKTQD